VASTNCVNDDRITVVDWIIWRREEGTSVNHWTVTVMGRGSVHERVRNAYSAVFVNPNTKAPKTVGINVFQHHL